MAWSRTVVKDDCFLNFSLARFIDLTINQLHPPDFLPLILLTIHLSPFLFLRLLIRPRDPTQGIILNIELSHQSFMFLFKIEVPRGHSLLVQHFILWTKKLQTQWQCQRNGTQEREGTYISNEHITTEDGEDEGQTRPQGTPFGNPTVH
jgi:hypothetical protein